MINKQTGIFIRVFLKLTCEIQVLTIFPITKSAMEISQNKKVNHLSFRLLGPEAKKKIDFFDLRPQHKV